MAISKTVEQQLLDASVLLNNILQDDLVGSLVDFFIQKDLFDRKLFEEKQILTSRGIQERWLRGREKRAKINIKKESWLIDASTVFEGEKLSKICIIGEAGVSSGSLPVETPQSKVEEIRLEERRESRARGPRARARSGKG